VLNNAVGVQIGQPKAVLNTTRNVISGNDANGVRIAGRGSTQNTIVNNLIGVAADGKTPRGNSLDGIRLQEDANFNVVGAPNDPGNTKKDLANTIRHNGERGIAVEGGGTVSNTFRLNDIDDNGNLGIDLNRDGVTLNDEPPGNFDPDDGPNRLQNFPVLTIGPTPGNPQAKTVSGVVRSIQTERWYLIDVYRVPVRDPSGHGEGREHLATTIAKPNPAVPGEYVWSVPLPPGTEGFVTATATRQSNCDTSEFSGAAAIPATGTKVAVNSTNFTGAGSLSEAILVANETPGMQEIVFNLPGPGPHSIALGSALPDITDALMISGQSQPGYVNRPVIVLDGMGGSFHAIRAVAPTQIGGLAFANLRGQAAIRLAGSGGHVVASSYIGTDVTGTLMRSNSTGVLAEPGSNNNQIFSNVISGNVGRAVELRSNGNVVTRNLIGPRANGSPLGNFDDGIYVAGSDNRIGSTTNTDANTIYGNGGGGVVIASGAGNRVGINSIDENEGPGVELGDGANLNQNSVQIEAASKEHGLAVFGEFVSAPNAEYRMDFYASDGADGATGRGEGARWLGFHTVNTDAFGSASVAVVLDEVVEAGKSVSALVTDSGGNTSEFAESIVVMDARKPTVSSTQFDLNRSLQVLDVRFSEDVGASLDVSDFNVSRAGVEPVPVDLLDYDPDTFTARLYFLDGTLPDGAYRLTVDAADVRDFAFNPLASDVVADFTVLAGDANGDAKVDIADLGILATNWQKSPRTFGQGDFNRDRVVDIADLGILATSWQRSVAVARGRASVARPVAHGTFATRRVIDLVEQPSQSILSISSARM
jgi:hypothetical protein